MNKLSQQRLVDGLIDACVSWREACLQVKDAYGFWATERGQGATSAFGRYMAALDREEPAAEVYAGVVRRVGVLSSSRQDPARPRRASATRPHLPHHSLPIPQEQT
jgi:hypothetical protein